MTRDEALAAGKKWSYGYAQNERFKAHIAKELPEGFRQYDLEMFFFLNYADYPTDIPREEHWWRAAERRWPTTELPGGRLSGLMVRNEWAEAIIRAAANYSIVNVMGGAGQGKTTVPIAFGITIWDYFEHTESGGRFTFSSVSDKKLKNAAWPTCASLYNGGVQCSPSIKKGLILDGSMVIKRKRNGGSGKGLIQAVLIANDSRAARRIDDLTGAHVPTGQVLMIDEAQSSPDALDRAAYNLRMHPRFFWLFRLGNPDRVDDYLGNSCKPVEGWESVDPLKLDEPPVEWETNYDGQKGYVLRFDNENSPGVRDPIKFHFMPTRAKIDANFSTAASKNTPEFWRFNRAWFVPEFADDAVIKWSTIEQMGCHKWVPQNDRYTEIKNGISFDPAPGQGDRSPLTHFQLRHDPDADNRLVLNFQQVYMLPKTMDGRFYQDAVEAALQKAREWQVPSGNLIFDDTSHAGFGAMMQAKGFMCMGIVYHEKPTERALEPKIGRKAREYCGNLITESALLLEAFVRNGQVRGLGDSLCPNFREEVCTRRLITTIGGKQQLEPKATHSTSAGTRKGFRDRMGFSPDIFDTLCQAAYFARERWGFQPGIDRPATNGNVTKSVSSIKYSRKFLTHA